MGLNEVDIDVKSPGLLEVPQGKEVNQLPQSHFQALINKKGYDKVIRGLTNLEVWNKNKNPELSKWASNMADKLKKANNKDEKFKEFKPEIDDVVYLDDGRKVKIVDKLGNRYKVRTLEGNVNGGHEFLVGKHHITVIDESLNRKLIESLEKHSNKIKKDTKTRNT